MVKKQPQPQAPSGGVTHATVPLDALHPHPRNYRAHPESQIGRLAASLARFGQVRSVVVQQGADGRYLIVAGHGLAEAAKREGYATLEADVIPAHWTADAIEGYLIADNESSREAEDDLTALAAMLEEQRAAGYHLESLGFSDDDLTALLAQLADEQLAQGSGHDVDDPGGGGDDFDTTPDESGPTRCQQGDLWQLGKHRLLCGDSTKREDVARLMIRETADMIFADPPYDFALDWTDVAEDVCSKHWLVMAGDKQHAALCAKYAIAFNGFYVLYFRQFSWNLNKYIPLLTHVLTAHLRFADAKSFDLNGMHSLTEAASKFDREQEHHHAKHVSYIAQFVRNFSPDDGLIYDPFAGSGSTLIAAERLSKRCYAVELEPRYVDVCLRRWEAETGREAVLLERTERTEQANGPQIEIHA